ncbi:hypothetical protein FACS1894113_0830 [Alphaproteobacteria bacterium]|nr:hypothetical protein FACS1894113_0830 [Alphaproteobacteria bacterium]
MENQTRLNKALSMMGLCSRRDADELIKAGKILVNNKQIIECGVKISPGDCVFYDGKSYNFSKNLVKKIWLYYKPRGLVTTHKDEKNRPTVFDDLKEKINMRVVSAGRLDLSSEGLLLITNDNDFVKFAENPKSNLERRYRVRLFGIPDEKMISELNKGVEIERIRYGPIKVKILERPLGKNCWIDCSLREGKNRELRNVFAHFGLLVNKLIRYKYGPYDLGSLCAGQVLESEMFSNI